MRSLRRRFIASAGSITATQAPSCGSAKPRRQRAKSGRRRVRRTFSSTCRSSKPTNLHQDAPGDRMVGQGCRRARFFGIALRTQRERPQAAAPAGCHPLRHSSRPQMLGNARLPMPRVRPAARAATCRSTRARSTPGLRAARERASSGDSAVAQPFDVAAHRQHLGRGGSRRRRESAQARRPRGQ